MQLVDTHTHLYSEQFKEDRIEVIQRAFDAGVTHLFLPNVDGDSIEGMMALTQEYPEQCFAMMGLHPCSVDDKVESQLSTIKEWLFDRMEYTFCAVGEIGLDYYWDTTYKTQQQEAFKQQIAWAKELNIPVAVHCRDAMDDILDILEETSKGKLTGVLHCFTGTKEQAERAVNLGFYLGIGGVVTFKNGGLDKTLTDINVSHLILETDAPYLAPMPYRGKRNESAFVSLIAQKLADVKHLTVEEVAGITTSNALKLFGKQ